MSGGYRPEFMAALRLLAEAFSAAAARGADLPVIVGGAAVEFHTGGRLQTGDFDLVATTEELVITELEARGFERAHPRISRGLYHRGLKLGVDLVSGGLFDGRADRTRVVAARLDDAHPAPVLFAAVEDMIADRLGQYESDPRGRGDMLEQARILFDLAANLDRAYLERRVAEECVDHGLLRRVTGDA